MENATELREKLVVYNGQLEQVHQLLEIDASNEQFLGLQSDLKKVISLTETLLAQVSAQESVRPVTSTVLASHKLPDSGSYSPGQADYESDKEEIVQEVLEQVSKEKTFGISKSFKVGDRIEVLGGARVFSGVVTAVLNETECNIRYFEFPDSEVKLSFTSLQPIPSGQYAHDQVKVGLQCQCKYAADLQFYPVTVTAVTQYGYTVTYTEYGNMEEVPLEYLRPAPSAVVTSSSETKPSEKETIKDTDSKKDTLALIPIPDNLQILPTDTEEEKRRKYKKLKSIKSKNHQIQQELQVKEVQQSWQKFVQKGAKRPLSGIGNKNSIFSSTDDSEGRSMTQFGERKRFKFDSSAGSFEDD